MVKNIQAVEMQVRIYLNLYCFFWTFSTNFLAKLIYTQNKLVCENFNYQ